MAKTLTITFGAMAPPIVDQLIGQNVLKVPGNVNFLQRLADSLALLSIHGILTDSEKRRARERLVKQIQRAVMETCK